MQPLRAGVFAILMLCSATACGELDYATATVRWDTVHAVPGGVVVEFGGGAREGTTPRQPVLEPVPSRRPEPDCKPRSDRRVGVPAH